MIFQHIMKDHLVRRITTILQDCPCILILNLIGQRNQLIHKRKPCPPDSRFLQKSSRQPFLSIRQKQKCRILSEHRQLCHRAQMVFPHKMVFQTLEKSFRHRLIFHKILPAHIIQPGADHDRISTSVIHLLKYREHLFCHMLRKQGLCK